MFAEWTSHIPFTCRAINSRPRRLHIRPRKVLPFKQERLSFGFHRRVGEAISKIQFGGVAAGFPKVAIGLARYASLRFGGRLNRHLRLPLHRSADEVWSHPGSQATNLFKL